MNVFFLSYFLGLSNFGIYVGILGFCARYKGTLPAERVVIPCKKPMEGDSVIIFTADIPGTVALCEVEVHTAQPGDQTNPCVFSFAWKNNSCLQFYWIALATEGMV